MVLNLSQNQRQLAIRSSKEDEGKEKAVSSQRKEQTLINVNGMISFARGNPVVQPANSLLLAKDSNGIPTISKLHRSYSSNSVELHSINAQGTSRVETILRLPKSIADNGTTTLINPVEGVSDSASDKFRVVIQPNPKLYHTFKESTRPGETPMVAAWCDVQKLLSR
jgi:hypothetical protein